MRIKNEGKVAEVLAEVSLGMPPEFEIPDSLYKAHLETVHVQFKEIQDEEHRKAIAVMRTVGEFLQRRAGGQMVDEPEKLTEENVKRMLSVAESWGIYGREQAEKAQLSQKVMLDKADQVRNELAENTVEWLRMRASCLDEFQHARLELRKTLKNCLWKLGMWIALGLLGFALILAFAPKLHAQESGVTIQLQQGGADLAGVLRRGPLVLNCSTNLTCTWSAATRKLTLVATGGGGAGTPCVTTANSFQYNAAGVFGCVTTMTSDGTINTVQAGANFLFTDTTDATKKTRFDLSALTTATTRVISPAKTGDSQTVRPGTVSGHIPIWDNAQGDFIPGDPRVQGLIAHDAPASAIDPVLNGCYASAAAPTDVTLDTDAVRLWCLRSGAVVQQLVHAGTLYDARQIRALASGTDSVTVSGTVTATGPLTDTQLRASAVPVSGPLTDTQLRATPVPVSGTVTATGPLTDTQLRATPVPVSGTVTGNQGTAAAGTAGWPITQGTVTAVTAAWTSATALDTAVEISVPNYSTVMITLRATSTMTAGTLNFEVDDGSGNWFAFGVTRQDTSYVTEITFPLAVINKIWQTHVVGATKLRVRLNPVITGSGTANIRLVASAGAGEPTVVVGQATASALNATVVGNLSSNGAAAATNRVGMLPCIAQTSYRNGTAATLGRDLAPDCGTDGLLWTAQLPAIRPASYSASATVAPAASATDVAVLPGNASNTVLVTKVKVSCTQTTAGIIVLNIIKRSAADTAGTSAGMTEIPDDSNYAAASSAALTYTANPTVGTAIGNVDTYKLGCLAAGTAAANDIYILNLTQKPIVLRGTAEQLAINLNGATVSGGSVALTYNWIETATILP